MFERLAAHRLELAADLKRVEGGVRVDHTTTFDNRVRGWYRLGGTAARQITGDFEDIDVSTRRRWRDCLEYRPDNLRKRFARKLEAWREPKTVSGGSKRGKRRLPK